MSNRAVPVLAVTACIALLFPATAHADASASRQPTNCTILGTSGDDVLRGTAENDVICGLGGDDVILGEEGDDVLDGGAGDDILVGGPGTDQLYGGADADQLVDTRGRSTIDGGTAADLCVAVAGSAVTNCERRYTFPGNVA